MTNNTNDRRQTLVVLPEMQRRMIVKSTLVPAVALVLLGGAVAFHCIKIIDAAAADGVDLPGLRLLLPSILAFTAAMAGFLIRQATMFSNKVGGPAYRIARTMAEMRQSGQLPAPIKLRDNDYLTELADEFNEVVTWIREEKPTFETPEESMSVDVIEAPVEHETAIPTPNA